MSRKLHGAAGGPGRGGEGAGRARKTAHAGLGFTAQATGGQVGGSAGLEQPTAAASHAMPCHAMPSGRRFPPRQPQPAPAVGKGVQPDERAQQAARGHARPVREEPAGPVGGILRARRGSRGGATAEGKAGTSPPAAARRLPPGTGSRGGGPTSATTERGTAGPHLQAQDAHALTQQKLLLLHNRRHGCRGKRAVLGPPRFSNAPTRAKWFRLQL